MNWRLADSLKVLREQIDAKWPGRSKASDGTIGDQNHASRDSDHNAWIKDHRAPNSRVVSAIDITNDPAHGLVSRELAEALIASRDPRLKYIISNAQICSSYPARGAPAWEWRSYSGSNEHRHHVHISVNSEVVHYDSTKPWNLDGGVISPKPEKIEGGVAAHPTLNLAKGSKGNQVAYLQRMLGIEDDGDFGPITERAVKQFQVRAGLPTNGAVDSKTWAALIA